MSPQLPVDLGRDALMVALYTAGPILAVGTLIGLLIGLAQALTQVQDQTLAFVPKLAAFVESAAFSMKSYRPGVVGIPASTPAGDKSMPGGKVPPM